MGFNVTTLEDFQRSHGFDMLVLGNVRDGRVNIGNDQLKAVYSDSYRYAVEDGVHLSIHP